MKHRVHPLDAYPDSWRCTCNKIFRSDSGYAICPDAEVKGFVRKFGVNWFHYVSIDGEATLRGQTDSWEESFKRVFRNVSAIRPTKPVDSSQPGMVLWTLTAAHNGR
jgi:hypothetical protein